MTMLFVASLVSAAVLHRWQHETVTEHDHLALPRS